MLHGRRRWILLVLAGLAVVLVAVALNPDAVLLTKQLQRATVEHERGGALYGEVVELASNGRTTQVHARVHARAFRSYNGDYEILVAVYRPDPRLHAIDVGFRTPGTPPLPYNALLLEATSGDWPPVTYRVTEDGGLRFAVDGLDGHTTRADFYLLADLVPRLPAELAVDITIDLRSSPSLISWRGKAQIDLPLASLGEGASAIPRRPSGAARHRSRLLPINAPPP